MLIRVYTLVYDYNRVVTRPKYRIMAETAEDSQEVRNMAKRFARTKTEVDLLPPFGEPEVVTTGNGSVDVAVVAIAVSGVISYTLNN